MSGISSLTALATGLLVGCASSAAKVVPATPAPGPSASVDQLPPAVDLSGGWETGSGNEPPDGAVVQRPSCAYNPPVWVIQQSGNSLKAWAFPESFNQGIARASPGPEKMAGSPGTISGVDVVIDDGQHRFVLRFDPVSGHLRGTRDGAPFWAARQTVQKEACPGIP